MENKIKRESLKTYTLIFENPTLIFSECFQCCYDYRIRIVISPYEVESIQTPRQSSNSYLIWDQVFIFQEIIATSNFIRTEIEIVQKNSSESILKFEKSLSLQLDSHELKFQKENYQGKLVFNLIKFDCRRDLYKYKSKSSRTFAKIQERISKQSLVSNEMNQSQQEFSEQLPITQNIQKQQNNLLHYKPISRFQIQAIIHKQIDNILENICRSKNKKLQLSRTQIQQIVKNEIFILNIEVQKKFPIKQFLKYDQEHIKLAQPKEKYSMELDKENIFDIHLHKSQDHKIKITKKTKIKARNKEFHITYGDKIYSNQNAITMQKSILTYSLPKAPRFQEIKYDGMQPSYYVGTSFKFNKTLGTSFGFGKRKPYPDWMVRNMTDIPAPNTYMKNILNSNVLRQPKGFTFGIPYSYYKNVRLNYTEQQRHQSPKASLSNVKSLKSFNKQKSMQTLSSFSKTPENHYHFKAMQSTK